MIGRFVPALPSWLTAPRWIDSRRCCPADRPTIRSIRWAATARGSATGSSSTSCSSSCASAAPASQADTACSATPIRNRRDEWIRLGIFARLRHIALETYDRIVGRILDQIPIDGSITKAPGGVGSRRTLTRRPRQTGPQGISYDGRLRTPLGRVPVVANCHDAPLLAPTWSCWTTAAHCLQTSPCTWTPATTRARPAPPSTRAGYEAGSHTKERRPPSRPPNAGT